MYDWIEHVGWDHALKLTQQMQMIPNTSVNFRADKEYDASLPRDESRMT
jgi:hypothetical protein